MKTRWVMISLMLLGVLLVGLAFASTTQATAVKLTKMQELGKDLFFDQNLSLNNNQACAACHAPQVGFTGPDAATNMAGAVYEGSITGAFGNRKPPAAAYGGDSPLLHYDEAMGAWVGGMFWDGRATGWTLGDPLAEQAKGPFLNPKEQAIPSAKVLCEKVQASDYARLYKQVWGNLNCASEKGITTAYNNFARSIAAYERSGEVSAYTSKFDFFYDAAKAKALDVAKISMVNWEKYRGLGLNNDELRGLAMFNTKGKCSGCHVLDAGPAGYPLFTDFTYDNLGIPKNLENPATIANPEWADPGLGAFLKNAGYSEAVYSTEMGKFKVPTLRNVDKRPTSDIGKAYGHNGYFKSLAEIVSFYNTRDTSSWPAPETLANMNTIEVGNLQLNKTEEAWIVLFLMTLNDQ